MTIKEKAQKLDTQLRIGKNGVTAPMIEEIKVHLKKRKMVKIKFLKGFIEGKDRKEEARKITELVEAELVYMTGNVLVVYKK